MLLFCIACRVQGFSFPKAARCFPLDFRKVDSSTGIPVPVVARIYICRTYVPVSLRVANSDQGTSRGNVELVNRR